MAKEDLSWLIHEIKAGLREYITVERKKTITGDGLFRCPVVYNHKHGDQDPSAHYAMKDGEGVWYCHTCGAKGTIYDLLYHEENMPITGPAFLSATYYLAQKLGIHVEENEVMNADYAKYCEEMSAVPIYQDIEKYLIEHGNPIESLADPDFGRGYSKEMAEKIVSLVPIGSVDHDELFAFLTEKYGEKFTGSEFYRATRPGTSFGKNSLTLSYRDQNGTPIRFIARYRNSYYKQSTGEKKISKYIQTIGLFGKIKEVPFLIDVAINEIKKTRKVIVTEGEFDCLAMHLMGYKNAVASRGVSITTRFIDMLYNYEVKDVTLVLDNDNAGIGAVKKNYKAFVENGMDVFVLPVEPGWDPDRYIREGQALDIDNRIDAMEYLLKNDREFIDPSISEMTRYRNCIEFVAGNVMMNSYQQKYSHDIIGPMFVFHGDIVYQDVKNMVLGFETKDVRVKKIQDKVDSVKSSPIMDRISVYEQGAEELRAIVSEKGMGLTKETYNVYRAMCKSDVKFPKKIYVGNGFDEHSSLLTGTISLWAGWPSNGKSSLTRNIMTNIIGHKENWKGDDENPLKPLVVHLSLDDDRGNTMLNYISMLTNEKTRKLRDLYEKFQWEKSPLYTEYNDNIEDFFQNSVHVFGSNQCASVADSGRILNIVRSEYPDRLLIMLVDALNNFVDFNKENQIAAAEAVVRDLKRYSVRHDAHVAIVAHLKKYSGNDRRPGLMDLKGSSSLEHEPQNIYLMYMDYHYKKMNSGMVWKGMDNEKREAILKPVIEMNIAKDKNHPAVKIIPYNYDPDNQHTYTPSFDDILRYEEELGEL